MNLKLRKVEYAGDLEKERVIIDVKGDDDLNNYMIVDNTFDGEGEPSNKHRHLYKFRFHKRDVSRGDIIVLNSREGKYGLTKLGSGANRHDFYWDSKNSIWNKGRDKCHLIRIEDFESVDVK